MGSSQKPPSPLWPTRAISLFFEIRLDVCVSRVLQECRCPGSDIPANVVSCTHSLWLSGLNQRTKQDTVFSHTLASRISVSIFNFLFLYQAQHLLLSSSNLSSNHYGTALFTCVDFFCNDSLSNKTSSFLILRSHSLALFSEISTSGHLATKTAVYSSLCREGVFTGWFIWGSCSPLLNPWE